MYTNTSLITLALIALIIGFAVGYLVGLFRWKNSPVKAEAESTAIRDGWHDVEQRFQTQIDELKQKLDEKHAAQPQEAQSDASKDTIPKTGELPMSEALNTTGTAVASDPVQQEPAVVDTTAVVQAAVEKVNPVYYAGEDVEKIFDVAKYAAEKLGIEVFGPVIQHLKSLVKPVNPE